ncbi:50S ribosomal protein L7/L12 [endosymbiont of Sipalinus gigas]|uniref:50S ribosomal protein L7/L12 n=1 Tax=endosymbiont of Sipalinus gigas TaxID=1972134 RepID=UPI000DC718D1|nr:50S ribosomal protein L7/L12 [endosymbiont of Sipalinus gigas]BBA85272.1 50S ribosomal protein L7/L12 [endosymbiont of Sipalinus gigas]
MSLSKEEILDEISRMSILDINDLILMIEKKFSISLSNISTLKENDKEEKILEKNDFNIILKSIGTNKISVIKSIRSILNLGLKESKDLVESVPVKIKEKVSKIDAENIKKILEESGANVDLE